MDGTWDMAVGGSLADGETPAFLKEIPDTVFILLRYEGKNQEPFFVVVIFS